MTVEGGGKKRLNRGIRELSGRFEREGGGGSISQSGWRGDRELQVRGCSEGDEGMKQLPPKKISFSKCSKLPQISRYKERENSENNFVDTNNLSTASSNISYISKYTNISTKSAEPIKHT